MPDMTTAIPSGLDRLLRETCDRVAPLWPLRGFVAVNPFMGLADQPFATAAQTLHRVAGLHLLPAAAPVPTAPQTVATALDARDGTRWAAVAVDEIGKWCAAWADEGQASWPMPGRELGLYAAWRAAMEHDRAPESAGLRGFRAALTRLPATPRESIMASLRQTGVPESDAGDYLHAALLSMSGWAGLLRQREWPAGGEAVLNLLAICLAWDAVLHALHPGLDWRPASAPPLDVTVEMAGLAAREAAWRRDLAAKLASPVLLAPQPEVQAVFCIDVRSEVFRRALEEVAPPVATLGFAGFFGFAIEHVRLGDAAGSAQCPVLLPAPILACETLAGASPAEMAAEREALTLRRRLADVWTTLRASAVSCFTYVETAGLLSAGALVRGALGRAPRPELDPGLLARLTLDAAPGDWQGRATGLATESRIAAAEAVLRAMSLTSGFGGLVLLVGHGSTSVNNPHAAGLDCGACGGHTGESNARFAASVLNDPLVRAALADRGLPIPADTWFLAALHDTTTDDVTLFEAGRVPPSQAQRLAQLQGWLAEAGERARQERGPGLGLAGPPSADIRARTTDWSEVRPEWALANNAAFIAAPRARTRGRDLQGRAFLHSYDWREDKGFGVLELILTAPMVVASWINLQYYGSTVDNAAWGCGNKTLHNVTGLLGVLEGQGGDLRSGLPWQSVHDGQNFRHEALRLQVFIEAPEDAMDAILARHPGVAQLVDNAWLHLFALDEAGQMRQRHGTSDWRAA